MGIFSFLLTETEILVRRRSALDFLLAFEGQLTFDLQININIKQNKKQNQNKRILGIPIYNVLCDRLHCFLEQSY